MTSATTLPTVRLGGGTPVPALGQGTWTMGEDRTRRADEIAALQCGLDLGLTLIDTAEMYGDGSAEELVREAIAGRPRPFIVTKAYPHHASARELPRACERSLRRLGVDVIDLYLLHWRGSVPLAETVDAMHALQAGGRIRHWGVSNLDVDDMAELVAAGGTDCATDQVLYNLSRRGPEFDLLPWLRERAIATMAYSPVEQGRLLGNATLQALARETGTTPAAVALAWLLEQPGVIAIPKAGHVRHVQQNVQALRIALTPAQRDRLDAAFAPPTRRTPLQML